VQADTVVPSPQNSQSFNRYLYTLGNPLRYIDPTGHIAETEKDEAQDVLDELSKYNVSIDVDWGPGLFGKWQHGLWTLKELGVVLNAVLDFVGIFDSEDDARDAIGGVIIQQIEKGKQGHLRGTIRLLNGTLNNAEILGYGPKWATVHELAHYWDWTTGGDLSSRLVNETGGKYKKFLFWSHYEWGGFPPKGLDSNDPGSFNPFEDFAESVAAYIYPLQAKANIEKYHKDDPALDYFLYYSDYFQTSRGIFIATLVNASDN
jgi:hypothetical protein